jgi:sterol 3beta-glucosyltransferase
MRILLSTMGSDGDLQPFYALGRKLLADGHDVRLAASDRYAARAAALGLPFVAVGPPWDEAHVRELFTQILAERQPLKQLALVMDGLVDDQRQWRPALTELVRDFDLIVYPPLLVAAAVAARSLGKPHVSAQFAPVQPAVSYGPTGASFGPFLNRLAWRAGKALLRSTTDARLNLVVTDAGLAPWRDVLIECARSRWLDLVAVSPHLLAKDPSWDERTLVTGYWFLDEGPFTPDARLAAFLEGERPAVVGFGSMMGLDACATTETILAAARLLGRKIVLLSGWAGLGGGDVPANVHVASYVPHAWLLDRSACMVHHGGAGTTAAAARAGIPQTVVWHLGDQPVWGKRVASQGLGLTPRSHRKLEARWLAKTIERMLGDSDMAARARALGERVRAEDGLAVAARAIAELPLDRPPT